MKHIPSLLRTLLVCGAIVSMACSKKSLTGATVNLIPGAKVPAGIRKIDFTLTLAGRTANPSVSDPAGADITFPTDAFFEIHSGSGALDVVASAKDASGNEIDRGTGSGTVTTGRTVSIQVQMQGGVAQLRLDQASHDFGAVAVGSTSAATTFTLTNPGPVPTGNVSLAFSEAISPYALVSDQCSGKPLPAAGSCTFGVRFSSATAGVKASTLTASATPGGTASLALTARALFTLQIATAGTGSGSVTADIAGTGCGAGCSMYDAGTIVKLTASPSLGSRLSAWTNACAGTTNPCAVTVDSNKSITANFTRVFKIIVNRPVFTGATVTSTPPGISCTSAPATACSADFDQGTNLSLLATTDSTARFSGWGGPACGASSTNSCGIPGLNADQNVTANFVQIFPLGVTLAGNGAGSVTSSPSGINCPATTCSTTFDSGATVTLTATPNTTSRVTMSGDCTASSAAGTQATCNVSMNAARNETVTFTSTVLLSVTKGGPTNDSVTYVQGPFTCGTTPLCTSFSTRVDQGSAVTLQARTTNGSGTLFRTWSGGACAGSAFRDCAFTASADTSVTANFVSQTFNTVFVSSTTFPSNLGGTGAYDTKCNQLATAAGINATSNAFVAWMSDAMSNAVARLGGAAVARGFMRLDGAAFADQVIDIITNNRIWNPISVDENGATSGVAQVWTGTNTAGNNIPGGNCNNWTVADATASYHSGNTLGGPTSWTDCCGPAPCTPQFNILCIEKDRMAALTLPAPPAGAKLIYVTPSGFTPALSTGVPGANTFCQSNAPVGTASTFKALLSTSTTPASSVLVAATNYFTKDGVFVGTGNDIAKGLPRTGIWQRADGTFATGFPHVWSGAATPGQVGTTTTTCNNWTDNAQAGGVIIGEADDVNFFFNFFATQSCANQSALYCVEQ